MTAAICSDMSFIALPAAVEPSIASAIRLAASPGFDSMMELVSATHASMSEIPFPAPAIERPDDAAAEFFPVPPADAVEEVVETLTGVGGVSSVSTERPSAIFFMPST